MNTLVVGGTSGLGLELARDFRGAGNDVTVVGRHNPVEPGVHFEAVDLAAGNLEQRMGDFVLNLPTVNTLVYAPGFFQEGHIDDLTGEQIEEMIAVCGTGLLYLSRALLKKQNALEELITVTSTSQWTPRELEPVYNFAKAGIAHFSNALALDPRVGRVMVAGPAGMDSDFWKGQDRDTSQMLKTDWVADRIMELRQKEYRYLFAQILRGDKQQGTVPRVEIAEHR